MNDETKKLIHELEKRIKDILEGYRKDKKILYGSIALNIILAGFAGPVAIKTIMGWVLKIIGKS